MAITIRNKQLVADIRALGAATGKGPADLIRHLVAERNARREAEEAERRRERIARRAEAMERLAERAKLEVTEQMKADMRRVMDEMYDDDSLPR